MTTNWFSLFSELSWLLSWVLLPVFVFAVWTVVHLLSPNKIPGPTVLNSFVASLFSQMLSFIHLTFVLGLLLIMIGAISGFAKGYDYIGSVSFSLLPIIVLYVVFFGLLTTLVSINRRLGQISSLSDRNSEEIRRIDL